MTATPISPALEDFADFLAKLAPQQLLDYKASPKAQKRLNQLLEKNKETPLTPDEEGEIGYYMMIEHLVRLAKTRALKQLNLKAA